MPQMWNAGRSQSQQIYLGHVKLPYDAYDDDDDDEADNNGNDFI